MAILRILILLFLHQTCSELNVTAPASQTALLFQPLVVLPCTFHMDTPSVNPKYLSIIWYFGGRELLKMDKKKKSIRNGLSFDEWAARKGNASLTIHNVATANHGTYKCLVIYSSHQQYREIQLTVYARPVLSILNKSVRRNTNNALTCLAAGFFPSDIGITWYRDGEVLKNQVMGKLNNYKERTYQVKSSVVITPGDNNQSTTFTCRVQHVSLSEVIQEDFQLVYEETSSTVPIVVGVVLVVLIATVIGIFCWIQKRRRAATAPFTLMDIEGPSKLIDGEEATLYCRATKCPENISVEWLEKRGGQACEILQSYGGDKEEEERLLDTQYGIISSREGPHYTSSLTFRPSVARHKDVTFICRYSRGKWKKEKTFHCRTICAKPQLLQPVSRSLFVSGELKYLVTLEKFYPGDITLRWTHGVGEPQETIQSTETFTDIPDGTYSVCSEVRIPEELLKDPEFRVRVSWEHQSLDTPGYKDLSIRDSEYTWNPVVEEIQTPPLFHDTPVVLQCPISEYFPDAITVTWLRRSENQELCEETEYKVISTTISRKGADNTYSCPASLKISPKLSVHQGAEYICRVAHPSLETPIEKRTKKLVVKAKPQMVEPIMITMGDSSRVLFTLKLQTFYPKDIEIKWKYEQSDKGSEMPPTTTSSLYEDLTYDVTSVVSIPINVFSDPQSKVSVTWKHESLDEPETRTLTVRDLPWRPQVGEIVIPKLKEGERATLTCNISGYFPDHLTVSWFKKEPGTDSDPVMVPVSKDAYKLSDKKKLNDKTFSCQSSLKLIPSFSRNQGTEIICRVEHPSLEHPIEKTTGPITIDLPRPHIGENAIPKLGEDKKTSLTSSISKMLPDKLNWFKKEPGKDSDPIITQLPDDDFQTHNKQKEDKTFSSQSSLTITPELGPDQGAEFICREDSTNVEHPIEKTVDPLGLDETSVDGTVQVQNTTSVKQSDQISNPGSM